MVHRRQQKPLQTALILFGDKGAAQPQDAGKDERHPQRPWYDLAHPLAADPQVEGKGKDDDDQHGKDEHGAEHLFGAELGDNVFPNDGPDLAQVVDHVPLTAACPALAPRAAVRCVTSR